MILQLDHCVYHILYRCNLSCEGCINYSNHLETHSLPVVSNWRSEIDALADRFEINALELLGGETLLHPEIQQILNHILSKANFKKVILVTNGLVLANNLWLRDVLANNPKLEIDISYHHDPEKDNKYNQKMLDNLSVFSGLSKKQIKNKVLRMFYNDANNTGILPNCYVSMKTPTTNMNRWKYTVQDDDRLPKQFSNNPNEAYDNCQCPYLHYIGGVLNKCSVTGTLRQLLTLKNKLDDWPLLRDYSGYDVMTDHSQVKFDLLKKPESVCTYCPVKHDDWEYNKIDIHTKLL